MGYYCNNEDEHRDHARRDFRYGGSYGYDREHYDRYSGDACKQAYTEEFDREVSDERRREEYREEERQREEMEMRQEEDRMERCRQEDEYYQQMTNDQPKQPLPDDDDLPF